MREKAIEDANEVSASAPTEAAAPAGGAKIHELPTAKAQPAPDRAPPRPAPANDAPPPAPVAPAPKPAAKSGALRRILLLLGPVALIAAALGFYLLGGRTVSTDNAYVKADKLNIATEVAGKVKAIDVRENERVKRGQPIFRIDDEPYRITLAGAEAQLGSVRNEILTLQASYRQSMAQIEQAKIDVGYYDTVYNRQLDLINRKVSTQTTFDQAKHDLDASRERVVVAQRAADMILSQLGGKADEDVAKNPRVQAAQSQIDKAKRDLALTTIYAPMNGVVANVSSLQIGQYLSAAQQAVSIVGLDDVWVDANPKETDLAAVKVGAKARVTVDAYPGREWDATVASISPATGAEFSVLPAQNTSGNWIKIVQRITVRLHVDHPADGPELRSGMSANVDIATGEKRSLEGLWKSIRRTVGF
ncbi:HlyD family secretion protein [Terrarubrum flagellatum]|uniref:HlyD family secretion protein n=1 Tax=Terrirubrum flagellatum TaxID=2895980 RepID=UPI0031453E5C